LPDHLVLLALPRSWRTGHPGLRRSVIVVREPQLLALIHDRDVVLDDVRSELERLSPACLTETTVAGFVERVEIAIARAEYYGVEQRGPLLLFVLLMFTAGPRFDEHPLVRRILRNTRIDADRRVEALARVPGHVWSEARRLGRHADWRARPRLVTLP
jgi:hypothetical protein